MSLTEDRKVFEQGNSLGITLPQEWVLRHGVSKGDVLTVYYDPRGNLVVLNPDIVDEIKGQVSGILIKDQGN